MSTNNFKTQIRKGLIEFCVLQIISRGEVYTTDIILELQKSKIIVVEGTLYPLLTRLKNADLLSYRWVESSGGPPRKYFSLTEKGSAFYKDLENTWREMADGVERVINSQETVDGEQLTVTSQPSTDNSEPSTENPSNNN